MNKDIHGPVLLRQPESWELLASEKDLITNQLLNKATMCVVKALANSEKQPIADFDLKFFVEVMIEFCRDHENLKKILAGEDLRWFDEEEIGSPNLTRQPTDQSV